MVVGADAGGAGVQVMIAAVTAVGDAAQVGGGRRVALREVWRS